jgi:hypothetical protein
MNVPGLISAMDDFTAGQGGIIVFQGDRDILAFLGAHDEFAPSRLTTEPRIRTGSALAVAQPSAKGRTSVPRMEVGMRGGFGNGCMGLSSRSSLRVPVCEDIADDGALPVLQKVSPG